MARRGFAGRGRGSGRNSFGGFDFSALGTSYAEVISQPREPEQSYPPLNNPPELTDITDLERKAVKYQHQLEERLQRSQYYLVEDEKRADFSRYSDKFRPAAHDKLQETDLDKDFFPPDLWQKYFHPKKSKAALERAVKRRKRKAADLDALDVDDDGDEAKEDDEDDENEDVDVDEYEDEEDDDYAENYFETGSQEDPDDVGGGEDGGGGDYD